jgi:hypothetical protein
MAPPQPKLPSPFSDPTSPETSDLSLETDKVEPLVTMTALVGVSDSADPAVPYKLSMDLFGFTVPISSSMVSEPLGQATPLSQSKTSSRAVASNGFKALRSPRPFQQQGNTESSITGR